MLAAVAQLRDFCRAQKPYAGLIEIDAEKAKALGAEIRGKAINVPDWRKPGVYPESDRVFANHSFWSSAVNFCYLDPENPKEKFKIGEFSGAEAMHHCFVREFGENLIMPEDIFRIAESEETMAKFFRGDVPIPMLDERRENLLEAALVLNEHFDVSPKNILLEVEYNAGRVARILRLLFPVAFGRDYVVVNGRKIVFAKRANLFPLEYQGRALHSFASSSCINKLSNVDDIGPVVDYQVPNGLRHRGIHHYSEELAGIIDSKTPVKRQSRYELAIRFATAETLLDLQEETSLTQVELDFPLWWEGRTAYKNGLQHMLCKTTDY